MAQKVQPLYTQEKRKYTTQAQIAVMRKMIIVAHSLYKNNTQYVEKTNKLKAQTMN